MSGETYEQHGARLEGLQMSALDLFLDAFESYAAAHAEGRKGDARHARAEVRKQWAAMFEILINQFDHRTAHMLVELWKDVAATHGDIEAVRAALARHLEEPPNA